MPPSVKTFLWTGCQGDTIAGMACMRQLGGGHLHIGNHYLCGDGYHKPIEGARYEALKALLEIQPYVHSVQYDEDRDVDVDTSDWRREHRRTRSLAHSQAAFLRIPSLDISPWISAPADPRSKGLVVCARSERYRNPSFPWARIAYTYREKLLFVGLPEEFEDFRRYAPGAQYAPTKTLLEVASLIKGSRLFIGNQSSPCWIAMAMGHPLIQETYLFSMDSKIERPNAQFVPVSKVSLPRL